MLDLKSFRERAGLNQTQASDRLGVSQAQYSRYENEPEKIPLEILRKIKSAFGFSEKEWSEFIKSEPHQILEDLVPGDVYESLRIKIRLIQDYLKSFRDPTIFKDDFEKVISDLQFLLKQLSRKPSILLMGHFDSGKTRIVNHLLRTDRFPTKYSPTTKITTLIYHKSEKPEYMREIENVWIFKEGFDISKIDDENNFEEYLIVKGDLDILSEHGVLKDTEPDNSYLGIVYYNSPLLKACNIIDTPGSGNEFIDDNLLKKIIGDSSLMMDVLIFASSFQGFLDSQDVEILGQLLNRLPQINSNPSSLLKNLFIVATFADENKTDKDIENLKNISCKRLNIIFGKTIFANLKIEDPDYIKHRIFTFWAELPSRYKKLEEELLNLVEKQIPNRVYENFYNAIIQYKDNISSSGQNMIDFLVERIKNQDEAYQEYQRLLQNEPNRLQQFNVKRVELNDLISRLRDESRGEVSSSIKQKLNLNNLIEYIRTTFNKKGEAAKDLANVLSHGINHEVKTTLEAKSNLLSTKMEEFFNQYRPDKITDWKSDLVLEIPFDSRAAFLGGLTTVASVGAYAIWASTLGNLGGYILVAKVVGLLSALGISVGGGAAASSAISILGGPITIAIGIGLLIGLVVFKIFGDSWQKSLAKKFIEKWQEQNYDNEILRTIDKFWDDTLNAFHIGMNHIESDWQKKLSTLEDLSNPANKEVFEKRLEEYKELKSFFDLIPIGDYLDG